MKNFFLLLSFLLFFLTACSEDEEVTSASVYLVNNTGTFNLIIISAEVDNSNIFTIMMNDPYTNGYVFSVANMGPFSIPAGTFDAAWGLCTDAECSPDCSISTNYMTTNPGDSCTIRPSATGIEFVAGKSYTITFTTDAGNNYYTIE